MVRGGAGSASALHPRRSGVDVRGLDGTTDSGDSHLSTPRPAVVPPQPMPRHPSPDRSWQPTVLWQPPSPSQYIEELEERIKLADALRRRRNRAPSSVNPATGSQ